MKEQGYEAKVIEIIIYGRGGQGSVVAAKLLADAVAKAGLQTQSFAAYGAERRGGRVESYVRIAEQPILIHSKVYEPDYIVIMDETLVEEFKTVLAVKQGGAILINSRKPPEAFSALGNSRIVTIDASHIAREKGVLLPNGMPAINTTVLGALVGRLPVIGIDDLIESIKEGKIPATERNVDAAKEAYRSVTSEKVAGVTEEKEVSKISVELHPVYKERMSPCEADCPAGHAIRKTISLIQDNRFEDALENIKKENPFPGICGRVCFCPCETHCNRNDYDEGIVINALERAVFDYADANKVKRLVKKGRTGKRVAIIGSGPAGMTCAYFLSILGHDVTVFEALPFLGGIPRVAIPEYRLPKNIVDKEIGQVIELGIDIRTNTRVGEDISFEDIMRRHDVCFVATGAHHSTKLNIPGEDSGGVISGLEFLKTVALRDEVDLGAKVVVIGGGNVAIDAARTAGRLGAQEVHLVCLESRKIMPAYLTEVEGAEKEGIKILYRTMPIQIYSNGKCIDRLECIKVRGGKRDNRGWLKWPKRIEGTNFMMSADTIIVAIGETVDVPFLPSGIEMDGHLIKVDSFGRTSVAGVYAAGDATMLTGSVVEAIGSGKRAALGIDIFLKGGNERQIVKAIQRAENGPISMNRYLTGDYAASSSSVVSFSDLNTAYFSPSPRVEVGELPIPARASNFSEVSFGLGKDEAIKEASRCFSCGQCNLCENCYIFCPEVAITFDEKLFSFVLNDKLCKGCGICINECPLSAISREGEAND